MSDTQNNPTCQHCNSVMKKWTTPPASTWSSSFLWICFNDECPYYVKGWEWMMQTREMHCSYRHSIDPESGAKAPIPIWDENALKDQIID